ncbi:MAG: ATP-binding protein [Vicinamibacterales bacterium]
MKTLFAKILVWLLATLLIMVAGLVVIDIVGGPASTGPRGPAMFFDEAAHVFDVEGRTGLEAYLRRTEAAMGGRLWVVGANGRDLVSGEDRTEIVRKARETTLPFVFDRSALVVPRLSADGRAFFWAPPPFSTGVWIQRLWLIGSVLVVLCYVLARHLTAPLRGLQRAVDRFGRGDFSARLNSDRRDELGQLAATFNQMAERIQALLEHQRTLLRDISHELRSPLTRLGLAVELARSGDGHDEGLDRIALEANRVNELVEELLSLARIENQHNSPNKTLVDLDVLLKDLVELCSLEAFTNHCQLRVKSTPHLTVSANEELLRRALENVIRNAIRYAPEQSDVNVSAERRGRNVRISVQDSGPGVPEAALSRIFEPFFRVDEDRNRESGGSGLGLAIAHRSVELHGGEISAQNMRPGLEVRIEWPAGHGFAS